MPHQLEPGVLRAFLEDSARPTGTLSYHELQGFLFTIASAPELVPPSEWMPMMFDEQEPGYRTLEEAQTVIGELMALYNAVNAAVAEELVVPPVDCVFRDDILANLADDAPIAQWSRGFLRGHQWLEDLWSPYVPEALEEEYAALLMTLSFFTSRDLAEAFRKEAAPPEQSLERMAETIRRVFPSALSEYAHLGRSIARVLAEHRAAEQESRRSARVGRNDPCPCGSGRKFKKCCGSGSG